MPALFETWTIYLSTAIEGAAVLIVTLAALEALVRALWLYAARAKSRANTQAIRIGLGRWLSLALEFALAADILRTVVAPSWDEIGRLTAIILLRTLLNFFLEREIAQASRPMPAD